MESCRTRSGIAAFVFAILLVAFNWPMMSIPPRGGLLFWLFGAWVLGIGLLALAARCADPDRRPRTPVEPGAATGESCTGDERAGGGDV
ncbi:hypothetical protein SAMN04488503_3233 [Humidesulfovibrio mexicanus]|uniref:Uncharacterized protein n=1 Tax=Humidesulfovibrio mexicanus TaxID=147047 RepID=A0A239CN90_9BACT|nr:hypothetical protein [Humidesulfovibrio mexicanus]SNS21726.1 hypothetical protein SAMN04488503_3233 [Humidesulfovibrio mexicanus]